MAGNSTRPSLSWVSSLDGLCHALEAGALISEVPCQETFWQVLLETASVAECFRFLEVLLSATTDPSRHKTLEKRPAPEVVAAGEAFIQSAITVQPITIAVAIGQTLASILQREVGTATSDRRPDEGAEMLLGICCNWVERGGPREATTALVSGGELHADWVSQCTQSLCSLGDRLASLRGRFRTSWADSTGRDCGEQLLGAALAAWQHCNGQCKSDDKGQGESGFGSQEEIRAAELLARLVLRGEGPSLAVKLCLMGLGCGLEQRKEEPQALSSSSSSFSSQLSFCGRVVEVLSELHPAAACNLVCSVVQAQAALLTMEGVGPRACSDAALLLLPGLLAPALAREGGPIRPFLAERLWCLPSGPRLPPAVIFAIVDLLRETQAEVHVGASSSWEATCDRWFRRWADPSTASAAEPGAERVLALRLARCLGGPEPGHGASPPSSAPFPAPAPPAALHSLLQGIHLRLDSQVAELRHHGMALAELLARLWPVARGEEGGAEEAADTSTPSLQFEGFDLIACGLEDLHLASSAFRVVQTPVPPPLEAESPAGRLFAALFAAEELETSSIGTTAQSDTPPPCCMRMKEEEEEDREECWECTVSAGRAPNHSTAPNHSSFDDPGAGARGEDSDDQEDEDDPFRNVPSLPALQTGEDSCSDLRLVQTPEFLRTGFQMLTGPIKGSDQLLGGSPQTSSTSSSSAETPATARARVATALTTLPRLIRAAPPELSQMAEPIAVRVLRMSLPPGLQDAAQQRQCILVSLLVEERSRSAALECLISDFTERGLQVSTKCLILEVLAAAARELSGESRVTASSDSGQETSVVARTPTPPKTRRFCQRRVGERAELRPRLNRFSAELSHFSLPLIVGWRVSESPTQRDPGLLSCLLRSLGVLLEAAGAACPDRDRAVRASVDLAEEFLLHPEALVRRCCLFLLSRALLVNCHEALLTRPQLLEWLETGPLREADPVCRRMLGGILTCLGQHSLLQSDGEHDVGGY